MSRAAHLAYDPERVVAYHSLCSNIDLRLSYSRNRPRQDNIASVSMQEQSCVLMGGSELQFSRTSLLMKYRLSHKQPV
jgi:hypothetical protein